MYESPIEAIYEDVQLQFEDTVVKAIQKVGINVDKGELIRALKYDRDEYNHGYSDGWYAKEESIVRCKDCKYYLNSTDKCGLIDTRLRFYETDKRWTEDCFCSWGERRDDEQIH